MTTDREYTDPSVLAGILDGAPWADPIMDPTAINWAVRQAAARVPFHVVNGRPVNPSAPTGIRRGRNKLGHWGEQLCADVIATVYTPSTGRHLLLVERTDGLGWALPGGYVEPGERPADAALRELREETGLSVLPGTPRWEMPARYVPDPRASDEAWMVTVPLRITHAVLSELPAVAGGDDARRAEWVPAPTYLRLVAELAGRYGGEVFAAHRQLLHDALI